jgi:tetratricopeptide (TPR) repeat protein
MNNKDAKPILSLTQVRQLNELLTTVNEMTTDSITEWHQSLTDEVQSAVTQIEHLTVVANQNGLIEDMVKTFDQKRQTVLSALEMPLKAIQRLADSGHLNDAQKIKLLQKLGYTHEMLTQWDIALDQYYRALDYCEDELFQKATMLKSIGRIKSKQRNYREANTNYHASLEIFSTLKDRYQTAQVHINIGFNEFQVDNYTEAEFNYLKAIEIAQATPGAERLVADAQMTLALLETVRGNFVAARSYYQQCVQCYTELDDERGLARVYYNMGMMCVDEKVWQEAGRNYQKSLEYAQQISDLHLIGRLYMSQTELAIKLGDLTLAQACCMHTIKTFAPLDGQAELSEAYKYAGQIQARRRKFDKATLFFQKSITVARACQSRLNLAEAYYEYGICLIDKSELQQARTQLNEALSLFTALEAKADIQNTQAALARINQSPNPTNSRIRLKRIRRA